jgi:hypothetical protein
MAIGGGWFGRFVRSAIAVAPWVIASAVVTVSFGRPLSTQSGHIRTLTRPPAETTPQPKSRGVSYEPWELVPS